MEKDKCLLRLVWRNENTCRPGSEKPGPKLWDNKIHFTME